jgi:type I site-specific restriction endonuclease
MPEQDKYYDPLRRKWVAATPEEKVRQWFIGVLRDSAGVPEGLMMSEVQMAFGDKALRADILIYGKDGSPLAIVECKEPEVEISAKTAQQALLYYAVLKADFIFLTNGKKTYIYKRKGESFDAMDHFPDLAEMEKR